MAPQQKKCAVRKGKSIKVKSLDFKVNKRSGYMGTIRLFREELTVPTRLKYGIPVLPDHKDTPNYPEDFLEVNCESDTNGVSLMLRRDTVYVVGFKPHKSQIYYELEEKGFIDSSVPSKICDNYLHLTDIAKVSFDKNTIKNAVNRLGNYDGGYCDAELSRSLVVLIFAVSESIRFDTVLKFVSSQLWSDRYITIGSKELDSDVRSWAHKSRQILDRYKPPNDEQLKLLKLVVKIIKPSPGTDRYKFPTSEDSAPLAPPRSP